MGLLALVTRRPPAPLGRPRRLASAAALGLVLVFLAGCDSLKVQRPLLSTAASSSVAPDPMPLVPLERAWRYDGEGGFGPAPTVVTPHSVIIATRHGEIHHIDAESGRRLGKKGFGDALEGTPVLLEGRLLLIPVVGGKYGLIAYDLVRARRVWQQRGALQAAGLLVADDVLIAAAIDGTVRGIAPYDGILRWSNQPDSTARFYATPTSIGPGIVAVADDRGRITALEVATGREVWSASSGAPVYEAPIATEGVLVVPTTRGRLVAFDAADGAHRWTYEAASDQVRFSAPAAGGGTLVVGGTDGILRALDPSTGHERWTQRFDGNVAAAPLVSGEGVYTGTLDEQIVLLDLATGERRWSHTLPGRIKSTPVIAEGRLIVPAEPRFVYAFRPTIPASGVASR